MAGDRAYRHAQGFCELVAAGPGGSASRPAERPSLLLPWSTQQFAEGDLARRPGGVPVHEAAGTGSLLVAKPGGRRGGYLASATRLPAVWHRLAAPTGDLASHVGRVTALTCRS